MEADLQKLTSEYCAIEKMDRMLDEADSVGKTDLVGVEARIIRRGEILRELNAWIIVAKHSVEKAHSKFLKGGYS